MTWPELTSPDLIWPDLIWTGLAWPDLTVYHLAYFSPFFWRMIIVFLFLTPKLKSERLELWVQATLRFYFILYSFLFFLSQDISPTFNYTCRHKFNAYYSQGSRFDKYVNWEDEALKHQPESIHKERSKLPNELVSTVCRTLKLLYADILILCIYLFVIFKVKIMDEPVTNTPFLQELRYNLC